MFMLKDYTVECLFSHFLIIIIFVNSISAFGDTKTVNPDEDSEKKRLSNSEGQ